MRTNKGLPDKKRETQDSIDSRSVWIHFGSKHDLQSSSSAQEEEEEKEVNFPGREWPTFPANAAAAAAPAAVVVVVVVVALVTPESKIDGLFLAGG